MIELGRYNQITRAKTAKFVGLITSKLKTQIRFLFYCFKYSIVQTLIPNAYQLPANELIIELMNSSIYFINVQLIKFFNSCFGSRDKLLSM